MDWIRRNWPDLLIGIALLAVIAGIIATLLNGGSFLPFGQSSTSNPPSVTTPAPNAATTPPDEAQADPASDPATSADDAAETPPTDDAAVTPVPPGQSAVGNTEDDADDAAVTPIPLGAEDAATPSATPDASAGTADSSPSETANAEIPSAAASPSAPFRIGVGSYSQLDNAERRAEAFRAEGYPVFTAQQNEFTVVLVGPYESRSEAETVQAQIRDSGLESDPLIYQLESGDAETNVTDTTGTTNTSDTSDTSDTSSASESAVSTAADAEGRYIQVGAYNSADLAAPQLERLEALGYTTTLQETEGSSLLRLWIGPFIDERLGGVQAQLNDLGIDNFVPDQ